jgi:hypothetical protein
MIVRKLLNTIVTMEDKLIALHSNTRDQSYQQKK